MKIVYVKTKKILIFSNKVNQILLIKQKIIIKQLQQNKLTIKKIIHKSQEESLVSKEINQGPKLRLIS